MAAAVSQDHDRRSTVRVRAEFTRWRRLALLRPGLEVLLLDLGTGGALVESYTRMKPGTRAELQLFGTERRYLRGRIGRCRVTHLDPLRFEGAVVFDEPFDWYALAG